MDFKSLLKFFDYKYIISELKKLRKGAVMILFIVCLCCAVLDFFLRKFGIVYSWLQQLYLIGGIISITSLLIKFYNELCDKIDARKMVKEEEEKYNRQVEAVYLLAKPIFDVMSEKELAFLKRFVDEKTLRISEYNMKNGMYDNEAIQVSNCITAKTFNLGLMIINGASLTHSFFSINNLFYDVLFEYFKENDEANSSLSK